MIRFSYDINNANCMTLKAHKIDVLFPFHNGAVYCVSFSKEEYDLSPFDDTLHGLSVLVDGTYYTLYQVMLEAERQYEAVRNETLREIRDENAMADELSSPEQTGRI